LLVETGVLKHDYITRLGGIDQSGNIGSNAVRGERNGLSEEFSKTLSAGSKREFVLRSILGAAQMGAYGYDGSLGGEVFDGGYGRADTGIVGDFLSVKGNVDIATNEYFLSLEVGFGEVLNRLLGLHFEGWTGTESSARGKSRNVGNGKSEYSGREELHFDVCC
jgi:hypothetical protein